MYNRKKNGFFFLFFDGIYIHFEMDFQEREKSTLIKFFRITLPSTHIVVQLRERRTITIKDPIF